MTAGWTAGCRCVSLTRHTPAATSEASCFDACARRSTCCQMPWDAMGCHGMPWDAMGCHGMPWWNAMGNPEIKKHGAPNIPNIPNSCSGTLLNGTMVSPRKFQWFRVKARKARHFCPTCQLLQDGPGLSEREQQDDGQHVLPREKGSGT